MRELMSAIAVLGLLIFSDFGFAQPDSPHEIEATRETYLVAKKREAEIKAKVMPARETASAIAAKMTAQLSANEAAYDAVAKDYAALRQAILKKYEERVEAAIVPASLTDEYTEYKRRYDLLLLALSKSNDSTGDRTFRRDMEKRIEALHQQIATARTESDKKVADIDRQLSELRERRPELDRRLAGVIALPMDGLFGQWVAALAGVGKAEGVALDAEGDMAAAFDKYMRAMSETSPPYPKAVTVSADGQRVYAAKWTAKQPAGTSEPTQNEADAQATRLRALLPKLEQDIAEMERELKENAFTRLYQAESMKFLGPHMMEAAIAEQNATYQRVLAQMAIESAAVTLEIALTGGIATVARKGAELASKEAEERVLATVVKSRSATVAFKEVGQEVAKREIKLLEQRIARDWAAKRLAAVNQARKGALDHGVSAVGAEKAAHDASLQFDRMLHSVTQKNLPTPRLDAFAETFSAAEQTEWKKLMQEAGMEAVSPATFKAAAAIAMHRGGDTLLKSVELDPVSADVLSVVASDGLELAFQKGLKFGSLQGSEALKTAGEKLGLGATRWQLAKTGAKGLFGPKVAYANLKDVIKPDISLLITAASTLGKAAATKYFGDKAEAAHKRYLDNACELDTRYQVYYVSLSVDQKVWELQQDYRRQRAQTLGYLSEMRKPRELKVEVNQPVTNPDATLGIELQFSTFLSKPPIVTLGGVAVPMKPDGPPESSDRWTGSVAVRKLSSGAGEAPMTIALGGGNKPFGRLDSVAATPAYMENVSEGRWTNYESGLDTQHKVLLRSQPKGLYERALATLTAVETEMQALREGDMKELLTREWHDGRGFHPYTRADLPFGYSVGSSFDDRDRLVDLKAEIAELKQIHQDQLSGKLSGEKFAMRAYEMVWGEIKALWEVDRGTACGDVYALAADRERAEGKLGDERDQTEDRLRKKYTADADEYAAGMEQLKQRQSATRKTQFDPYAKRYQAVAHRLEDRCKRWTPELLRWRDFARQSSAAQDDVHADAMHGFEKTIGDNFSQEALDGLKTGYFTFDTQCGGEPWCKAGLYPDIQTDKDYPAGFGMDNIVVPYVPERPR